MNDLVNEAKADVNIAVADIEQAIEIQKDEWRKSFNKFDDLYKLRGSGRVSTSRISTGRRRACHPGW